MTQYRSIPIIRNISASAPFTFAGILAVMAAVGFIAPRALSFLPAVLGLFSFALLYFTERQNMRVFYAPFIVGGGILALALISCLWSIDAEESLDRCLKMMPILIFGAALVYSLQCLDKKWLSAVPIILPYILIFGLVWNAAELWTEGAFHKSLRGLPDNFKDYTTAAHNRSIYLCLLVLPFAGLSLRHQALQATAQKYVTLALIVLLIMVLILTQSQTAHVALILGVCGAFFVPIANVYARSAFLAMLGLLMITAPFLAPYLFQTLPELMMQISWLREGYAPERLEIWDFVSRYALQSPIYGHGIEATRAVEAFDSAMIYRPVATVLHPHNFALQLWMEFGLIGVLSGIVVAGFILQRLAALPAHIRKYALFSFITALVSISFAYGVWQGWWLGGAVMAIAYAQIYARLYNDADAA